MADNQVILEFIADTQGLKLAAQQMLALGQVTKEQYAAFTKANQDNEARLKAVTKAQMDVDKAVKQTTNDAKNMNDQFRQLTTVIAGEVIKETIAELAALGQEVQEVDNKGKSLKSQLRELKAELALMEQAGEESTQKFMDMSVAAAQLEDQIGDTNARIRQMASDTRTFDLAVEAVRGVAAAFSVAQGSAALFGKENEDVQKALLKVQAAMALATGVQELANIATTKGGIATSIAAGYQSAYAVVVGTSTGALKLFRIALAATGIGLAIVGIAALVENWDKLTAAVREYLNLPKGITGEEVKKEVERYNSIKSLYEDEVRVKASTGEDTKRLEIQRITDLQAFLAEYSKRMKGNTEFVKFQLKEQLDLQIKKNQLEKQLNDEALKAYQESLDKRRKAEADFNVEMNAYSLKEFENWKAKQKEYALSIADLLGEELKNTPDLIKMPELQLPVTLQPMDAEDMYTQFVEDLKKFEPALQAFAQITNEIFGAVRQATSEQAAAEIQALNDKKEAELSNKELTEGQKAIIEKKYQKEIAKVRAQQFEQERALRISEIVMNSAVALTKLLTTTPPVLPIGTPNPAYFAGLAVIAAQTAAQSVIVASAKPPAFAKGGKNIPGGMKLVGEEGPELIWTPGGETVIPHADTAKILEAWSIPTPKVPDGLKGGFAFSQFAMDYGKIKAAMSEALAENPTLKLQIDKAGMQIHTVQKGKVVEILNTRYDA